MLKRWWLVTVLGGASVLAACGSSSSADGTPADGQGGGAGDGSAAGTGGSTAQGGSSSAFDCTTSPEGQTFVAAAKAFDDATASMQFQVASACRDFAIAEGPVTISWNGTSPPTDSDVTSTCSAAVKAIQSLIAASPDYSLGVTTTPACDADLGALGVSLAMCSGNTTCALPDCNLCSGTCTTTAAGVPSSCDGGLTEPPCKASQACKSASVLEAQAQEYCAPPTIVINNVENTQTSLGATLYGELPALIAISTVQVPYLLKTYGAEASTLVGAFTGGTSCASYLSRLTLDSASLNILLTASEDVVTVASQTHHGG